MATAILAYELDGNTSLQSKVKQTLIEHFNYTDKTRAPHQMPDACLRKRNTSPGQALKDLEAAVSMHRASLQRSYAFELPEYSCWS
jgi:hypothetical protein